MANLSVTCVSEHEYLGILLTSSKSFSSHIINNIISKVSRVLNLIRRNLAKCSKEIKIIAYLSLVLHPILYSSAVWDPHTPSDVLTLEKYKKAAHGQWVMFDYGLGAI